MNFGTIPELFEYNQNKIKIRKRLNWPTGLASAHGHNGGPPCRLATREACRAKGLDGLLGWLSQSPRATSSWRARAHQDCAHCAQAGRRDGARLLLEHLGISSNSPGSSMVTGSEWGSGAMERGSPHWRAVAFPVAADLVTAMSCSRRARGCEVRRSQTKAEARYGTHR
jgi:hypothetical protein